MENLERVTAKIFASNANLETEDIGQFGSALAGKKVVTGDIATIQSLPAFEQGWRGAVLSTRNYPPLPEMAGLQKVLSYQEAYLLQKGIPEWDAETTYYANTSFCQVNGNVYQSLTDNNIGNNPATDSNNWQRINFNGADISLSNLSDAGIDFINQSKAMYTGEISSNPIVYKNVEKACHSSFSPEKFNIVGNPVITANGILSNISEGNYAYTRDSFNFGNFDDWELTVQKTVGSVGERDTIFNISNGGNFNNYNANQCYILSNGAFFWNLYTIPDEGLNNRLFSFTSDAVLNTGKTYTFKFKFTGTQYLLGYAEEDTEDFTWLVAANSEEKCGVTGYIQLGIKGHLFPTHGTFNLKYFNLKANGLPVFNGNETGLDIIKPDNYTVVGNPIITADGMLSGLSTSNKIQQAVNYTPLNKLVTNFKGIWKNKANSNQVSFVFSQNSYRVDLTPTVITTMGLDNNATINLPSSENLKDGDIVEIETILTPTVNTLNAKINGKEYTATVSGDFAFPNNLDVETSYIYYWAGSVDLNYFKIYADGKLVYQPCLKVPYTLTFGGAKIVDMQYLDRVKDAYEQGYIEYSYLTIDEENRKFTLPQGMSVYEGIANNTALALKNKADIGLKPNTTDVLLKTDKAEILNWSSPNLGAVASKAYNTEYTAESNGWLYFNTHLQTSANNSNANSYIQVYGALDNNVVYGHLLRTNWDGFVNTVQNDTMNSAFIRVYKGQKYKLYTEYIVGNAALISYVLNFYPDN